MADATARSGTRPWLLLAPGLAIFLLVFVLPLADMLMLSFKAVDGDRATLENFGRVFGDSLGRKVVLDSLALAGWTTAVSLVLGFPLAYQAARSGRWLRSTILVLVSFPLLTSSVVRTFGWQVLLFPNGALSTLLKAIGIANPPVLMGTQAGVVLALVAIFLPFMVLTLFSVIRDIDPAIEEAAIDLGDHPFTVWWRVTIPLCRNGLIGGSLLVFSLSLSAYVTPKLIGQSRVLTLATTIFEQAIVLVRYEAAAAFAVVLLAITLIVSLLATRAMQAQRGGER